jgi:hypothetical protein
MPDRRRNPPAQDQVVPMLKRLAALGIKDAHVAATLRVSERTVLRWWIGRPCPKGKRWELAACVRLVALLGPQMTHMADIRHKG